MSTPTIANRVELSNRNALIERLRIALPKLLSGSPIALAYLYGSAAAGTSTPLSDIDVALIAGDSSALSRRFEIEADLAAKLGEQGILRADARLINDAPIMLKGTVVTTGVLVYSTDDKLRIEFEAFTRRLYFDYLPVAQRLQDEYIQVVLNRPVRTTKAAP
ncbi:MAG TPA: nucleotidyltransferase domain-containing protein [Anaerolineae bacterium]|nr:nucleotidyltransferase domain-containing protein [Anaerolineae bacterium]